MSYTIVITETAKSDLKNAVSYITYELKNPNAALKLLNYVEKQIYSLNMFPKRNPDISYNLIDLPNIRYLLIENYLAFYTIDDELKIVRIIRFLYNKRDWQSILKNEKF